MASTYRRDLAVPDEERIFPNGKAQFVQIGGGTVARFTLQPGWCWSKDVKPIVGTTLCEVPHFHYQATGRLHVVMSDGSEYEFVAGEVCILPPGHNAWVVGDEPVTLIDWFAASNQLKT